MNVPQYLLAIALCAFASASHAVIVNVDPSRFESGTDISNAFDGVELSFVEIDQDGPLEPDSRGILRGPLVYSPIYAIELSTGTVFGHKSGPLPDDHVIFDFSDNIARYYADEPPLRSTGWYGNAFRADFDQPTNFVQLIGGGFGRGNYFAFDVWSTTGEHLANCINYPGSLCNPTSLGPTEETVDPARYPYSFTFNSGAANIGFITAGGWSGGHYVHSLTFTKPVPEPATWALLLIGIAGIAGFRRIRLRQC